MKFQTKNQPKNHHRIYFLRGLLHGQTITRTIVPHSQWGGKSDRLLALNGGGFPEGFSCHHSNPIRYIVRGASHPVICATVARPRRDR
jgi:hypothetical protein